MEAELASLIRGGALSHAELALVELGIQHEQQHQELILTDVRHLLSRNPLRPAYQKTWPLTPIHARRGRWIAVAAGSTK